MQGRSERPYAGIWARPRTQQRAAERGRATQRAAALIDRSFAASSRASNAELIVIHSDRYTVDSQRFRRAVDRLAQEVRREKGVARVTTYVDGGRRSLVSRDRHAALVTV